MYMETQIIILGQLVKGILEKSCEILKNEYQGK